MLVVIAVLVIAIHAAWVIAGGLTRGLCFALRAHAVSAMAERAYWLFEIVEPISNDCLSTAIPFWVVADRDRLNKACIAVRVRTLAYFRRTFWMTHNRCLRSKSSHMWQSMMATLYCTLTEWLQLTWCPCHNWSMTLLAVDRNAAKASATIAYDYQASISVPRPARLQLPPIFSIARGSMTGLSELCKQGAISENCHICDKINSL